MHNQPSLYKNYNNSH